MINFGNHYEIEGFVDVLHISGIFSVSSRCGILIVVDRECV